MELRIVPVIQFVTIVAAFKLSAVSSVPMKYEIGYRSSIDLDTEQTEARYDQGMLADIINDERPEMQKAESCVADNFKYDHGQKILRFDPCEICLCIDGEIFCWWKQCDVPSKPDLNESPLGSDVQLTTPAPPQSQPATTDPAFVPSSTTMAPPSRATNDVTTTTITTSVSSTAAPSYPDQPDHANVRMVHPQPPPENIPQNILSFPQSPPIMMFRPAMMMGGKNATSLLGAATATGRNKHGGPLKKVKPLHLANGTSGKKPYRKSKSKGYVINYGHIEGGLEDGSRTRVLAVTERIPSDGMRILNDDGRAFQGGGGGGGFGMGSNGDDEDENESDNDDGDDEDDEESEEAEGRSNSKAVGNSGENFGGFGYGMIKEPEDDKQQHYIITSSGHVEMFDDNSMEATENAFGMNRLPLMQHQQQPLGSSTTIQPMALVLGGTLDDDQFGTNQATSSSAREGDSELDSNISNRGGPIPPLITMTTNVTQHSNYSVRFSTDTGGSPPLTPYAPLSSSSGSVIDVLNSTVDGDYLDDNQTELIYPAVPGLSGGSSSSSSYRRTSGGKDGDGGGGGLVKATTTTTTAATASSMTPEANSLPELHCVVMGVSYKVGAVLKQETGNCLHCVCVAGPESEPVPRVTCTPLNCPPLILPDILDGAGF